MHNYSAFRTRFSIVPLTPRLKSFRFGFAVASDGFEFKEKLEEKMNALNSNVWKVMWWSVLVNSSIINKVIGIYLEI